MAQGDASVRLSVEGAETVRAALEKLGKDGQAALEKLNAAGSAAGKGNSNSGLNAVAAVIEDLKAKATGLAFNLGPIGTGLIALGPVGLAAGAALGGVAAALSAMNSEASRIGDLAQALRNLSETTGISGERVQTLLNVGGALGIESEKVASSLSRFTAQLDQVHQASGPLYEQIVKVNPALADQLVKTRDNATAWNLLAQAYTRADTAQRAAIALAAFGRGNIGTGRVLEATALAGGIDATAQRQSSVLTDEQIKKFAELNTKIEDTKKHSHDLMASLWTEEVLQRQLAFWHTFDKIAERASSWKASGELQKFLSYASTVFQVVTNPGAFIGNQIAQKFLPKPTAPEFAGWAGEGGSGAYTPTPADKETAESKLNTLREQMGILGAAATTAQQLNLKQAELNALVEKAGGRYGDLAVKAKDYYAIQLSGADLQIKVQNNVATADELFIQRQKELNQLVAHRKLTQDQANESLRVYAEKIIPETINAERLRSSLTPALTKLAQDSDNLRASLDQGLAGALQGVSGDLWAMAKGTTTVAAGLRNMTQRMGDAIAQAALMKSVVGPIAGGLSNGLSWLFNKPSAPGTSPVDESGFETAFPSARGNVFGFASGGAFTNGIYNRPTPFRFGSGGALGVMGEAGPEAVMPLARGRDGKLGVAGGGGGVVVNINNNHPGVAVETREQRGPSGMSIEVMIEQKINATIASGRSDRAMGNRYGLNPMRGG